MKIIGIIDHNKPKFFYDTLAHTNNFVKTMLSKNEKLNKLHLENSAGLFFSTVIPNPKDIHQNDYDQLAEYTKKECSKLDLTSLPLSLMHRCEEFTTVGKVLNNVTIGKQRDVAVACELSNSVQGKYGAGALIQGFFNDCSLQHWSFKNSDGQVDKVEVEISLCYEGKRPESNVHFLLSNIFKNEDTKMMQKGDFIFIYAHLKNIDRFTFILYFIIKLNFRKKLDGKYLFRDFEYVYQISEEKM